MMQFQQSARRRIEAIRSIVSVNKNGALKGCFVMLASKNFEFRLTPSWTLLSSPRHGLSWFYVLCCMRIMCSIFGVSARAARGHRATHKTIRYCPKCAAPRAHR